MYEGLLTDAEDKVKGCDEGQLMTNTRVLEITALMFGLFVIAQIIGGLASNSLALLGDAVAMSVDVVSYSCSIYGERIKAKYGFLDKKTRLRLNVWIPLWSVLALVGISAWICSEAIEIIVADFNGDNVDEDDDVDVNFMFGFAGANFLIDIVSAKLFLGGHDGHNHGHSHGARFYEQEPLKSSRLKSACHVCKVVEHRFRASFSSIDGGQKSKSMDGKPSSNNTRSNSRGSQKSHDCHDCEADSSEDSILQRSKLEGEEKDEKLNLNMMSAFMHAFGDTMRTLSTLCAALVASVTTIRGDSCDAWACIICAVTVILLVIPLLAEIRKAYREELGRED